MRPVIALCTGLLVAAVGSSLALAHEPAPPAPAPQSTAPASPAVVPANAATIGGNADKIIGYRQKTMKAIGDHFGAAGMIAKGDVVGRNADMLMHANALYDLSHGVSDLFPAGTGPDSGLKTSARAEVWSQNDKFVNAAKDFEKEAGKLVDAAKEGDVSGFKEQFGKVGEACGNCHDTYRVKD
jgi:cytochrome c556